MNLTSQRLTAAASLAAAAGLGLVIGRLSWRAAGRKAEPLPLPAPPLLLPAGASAAAEEETGPALDLAGLTELSAAPERFYLPDSSLGALADSFAAIDGARLPLHSQVCPSCGPMIKQPVTGAGRRAGSR